MACFIRNHWLVGLKFKPKPLADFGWLARKFGIEWNTNHRVCLTRLNLELNIHFCQVVAALLRNLDDIL
jgi:hypothetical protein